ncbi:hypothetical protein CLV49_0691 [Labedella gwakjiensis]|uniref:Uncharacterized protein n=1 Tax=Labedella gwakjiensis TaxID=390269 RepID=A0A2P8GT08_9MICO|nr:hypothetical protein [Labedella gwakjiensis]PSL37085.1 hypothetical protein CLV49_0691 [Labedella gwakjiensis]RUQ82010.1 hypothetical protein ELQ93_17140 [Labedella gwakjiensis]
MTTNTSRIGGDDDTRAQSDRPAQDTEVHGSPTHGEPVAAPDAQSQSAQGQSAQANDPQAHTAQAQTGQAYPGQPYPGQAYPGQGYSEQSTPPWPTPAPPSPRKRRKALAITGIVVGALVLLGGAFGGGVAVGTSLRPGPGQFSEQMMPGGGQLPQPPSQDGSGELPGDDGSTDGSSS